MTPGMTGLVVDRPDGGAPEVVLSGIGFRHGARALLHDLNFHLPAGKWTCLLGASGVGKSTLVRLIAGLDRPDGGTITAGDGAPLAGRFALMAQQDLLLPWLTALDNVCLGARLRAGRPTPDDRRRAGDLLGLVGLAEVGAALPHALSGGMRQRVALARTLMEDRPLVLMDEPFSAVDVITRLRLQDLAARLLVGRTVLLVTHDPLEALRLGDQVVVMAGRPATIGSPLYPPGPPPRPPGARGVLDLQAALLERLAA